MLPGIYKNGAKTAGLNAKNDVFYLKVRGVIGIKCAGQNIFNTVQAREVL